MDPIAGIEIYFLSAGDRLAKVLGPLIPIVFGRDVWGVYMALKHLFGFRFSEPFLSKAVEVQGRYLTAIPRGVSVSKRVGRAN